jgi:hypothetical protein
MAEGREVNSFECIHCGETLENWNSAWVPTYRLIVGPTVHPIPHSGTFDSSLRSLPINKEE